MNDICLVNCRKKCRSADVRACIFNNKLRLQKYTEFTSPYRKKKGK